MDFEIKRQKLLDVFGRHKVAVIATADKQGKPESALVGFNYQRTLELIFGTFISFRKYRNLQMNPQVAFVIGWQDDATIQYEGVAAELQGAELTALQEKFLERYPKAGKYLHHSEERLFKVTPTWIRYTDLASDPEDVFEVRF